jgi:predicted helicase
MHHIRGGHYLHVRTNKRKNLATLRPATGPTCRTRIRVLVKDAARTKQEFGPYVEAIQGNVNNAAALKQAMSGVHAMVVTGATGQSVHASTQFGVKHVVLASSAGVPLSCSCQF